VVCFANSEGHWMSMEVEYELTPEDLYAFQWRAVFASPRGRRARRMVYLLWFLAVLLFSAVPAIGADGFAISRMNFTFLVVAFPIVVLFQWALERRLVRRAILQLLKEEKPGKGQLGKHRIVVSEDGLFESTVVGESRTSWAGVDRIEQNPEYIFIYTSAAAAHVIPKRAFRDMQEAEGFLQLSRTSKEAAG
jgi:YcxB-like protein